MHTVLRVVICAYRTQAAPLLLLLLLLLLL
jgi:hypothetical protein